MALNVQEARCENGDRRDFTEHGALGLERDFRHFKSLILKEGLRFQSRDFATGRVS